MRSRITVFILFISIFSSAILSARASTYPEDLDERRRKGFGSIIEKDSTGAVTVFGRDVGSLTQDTTIATAPSRPAHKKSMSDYFWQASVDSVRSMPIVASDSSGGVISTDWHEDDKEKDMRYRLNISIRGSELKVNAFKQVYKDQNWRDGREGTKEIAAKFSNKIIERARELQAQDKSNK